MINSDISDINVNIRKKTICLNMIVKNEAHIIASTLQNILDHMPIDYWVISDTGSTDNTIDIITAFFREKNIPGEIFLDEWKDFGHNRTIMLEHAFNKSDYVFIFDADDLICGSAILPLGSNVLTKDAYYIPFENPISYHRLILASNRMRWKYVGVLHEYIVNIDPIRSEEYLSGDYYINSRRLGNRSKNPNKYLDDAITLEKAFQNETADIHLKNRYAYYCAQSYHDAGKHDKAIEWYEKTLTLDYSTQYKYSACIRAGDCYMYLNNPDGAIKIWGKAYEYDKERPEAISNIMEYYYKNGVHFMVTALYNQFKSRIDFDITNEQSKYKVFLDYSKFHNIHYYNSISGYYSGDFLSAYEACKYLLLHDTNTLYMENAISNLKFYSEQFKQDQYNEPLLQFFIGYLNDAQKPLHIKRQIWDFSKEMIKTNYSDKYLDLERIIHSNTQHNVKNNVIKSNTYKSSNKILIYTGWMTHLWNQSHVNDKALGGSEKAVVYLSQQFPTTYEIIISGDVEEGSFNNITYIHQNNLQAILDKTEFHTVIISRYICFLERFKNIKTNKLLLSLHDTDIIKCDFTIDIPSVIHKYINHIDNVIVLTNYHKSVISSKYPILNDKFTIINNGIDVDTDEQSLENIHSREKIPNKFVYTSCSYRGLNTLLNMWSNILSVLPDATLDISSYDTFPKNEDDARMLNIINEHSSSITHHGKLNKRDLYNMISKAEYWFYPTHFYETSCITALEMLLNNTICIYYPIGALVDTIGNYGITVNGDNAIDTIVNLSTSKKALLRKNGREYALSCSWKNRYALWEKVIGLDCIDCIDCIDCSVADCTDGNKTKWCFYYHNFTIETVEQFINNQVNHDGGDYDILISNNKDEIMRWQPDKLSFVYAMFDESIIHSLSTNENRNKCEISILQTEPLNLSWWFNAILDIHTKYPSIKIYDYSKSNIKILNQHNITNCEYLSYNIQQDEFNKLTRFLSENRNNGENELYDFGFIFDWKSLPVETQHIINPPRRSKVIDFLRNSGFKVNIIAGYDDDRDIELSKCKLILNIHGQLGLNHNPGPTECSNIFEHVRCDRLLETGYTVLSETSYELDADFVHKYPNLVIINYDDFFNIDIITEIVKKRGKEYALSCSWKNRVKQWTDLLEIGEDVKRKSIPLQTFTEKIYDFGIMKTIDSDNINERCLKILNFLVINEFTINYIDEHDNNIISELAKCKIILNIHGIMSLSNANSHTFKHFIYDSLLDAGFNILSEDGYCLTDSFIESYPNLQLISYEDFFNVDIIVEFYNNRLSTINHNQYVLNILRNTHVRSNNIPNDHIIFLEKLSKVFTPNNMIIYDIGSSVLHWTQNASNLWKNSIIYPFDGMTEMKLFYDEYNNRHNTHYKYNVCVLCDEDYKRISFYQNEEVSSGNSYYKEIGHKDSHTIFTENHIKHKIGMKLETVVRNKNIPMPDLIKIDVQGAELDILKGSMSIINHAKFLIVELQHTEYNKGAPLCNQTRDFLIENGWQIYAEKFSNNGPDADWCFINTKINTLTKSNQSNESNESNEIIYNKNKVDSEYDDTNNSMLQYGQLYNTDKVTHHEYHKYYEPVLKPFYNSHGSIIEIGLGTGVSLPMWKNLFKYAHIYGVDKEYENRGDDRHTIYKADQSNVNDLNNLKKSLTDKNVFFINDDGSHIPEHQLLTFNTLFPIVAEGGFYIIEDIETSYWTRGECYGYKTNYGYKHPNSMIEIFKEAADIINREFIVDKTRLSNKIQHYDYIESITFARNCIIVKKNYNANRDYRFKHFI